jgi:CheY-like chemotaxis protein
MNVLYSEDNKGFRRIIGDILTDLGHQVTSVGSAEESIEKIRSGEKFDAIISDNQMAGLRGMDLMKTPEAQSIPIRILLSLDSLKYKDALQAIGCIPLSKGAEDLVKVFADTLVEKK